jgi:hypothetical protein
MHRSDVLNTGWSVLHNQAMRFTGRHSESSEYEKSQSSHYRSDPEYTAHLGLRARLSQVWINKWTVLLLLILCRLILTTQSLDDSLVSAKSEALSACTSVEKVGSSMASMPHYLSGGVNALAADGVTSAVNALMDMLLMTVTGVGEIILFVINMLTSTYVCLITLVVAGSLHVALDVIKKVTEFMEKAIEGTTDEIASAMTSFQGNFNSFLDKLNFGGIFGGGDDPPKISLDSQIEKLRNVDIDTNEFVGDLQKIKDNIPTFADVQNATNAAIRFPFNEVKKLINDSIGTYNFDRSIFPLAQKKELTFCTDNPAISDFFGNLGGVVSKSRTIFMIVLIILAVLVCIPMAYREIRRWRTMNQRIKEEYEQRNDVNGPAPNPRTLIYVASRPYTGGIGLKLAGGAGNSKKQLLIRWWVAYATSIPALFVLTLGIAGLFSCLCQYIVLKVLEREVPALASEVGDFSQNVVYALNNASTDWATSSNAVIASTNTQINNDVFGWVNTTTTAVNNTLNTFTEEMANGLDVAFGGTILHDPIKEVHNCLIGLKVVAIQKGLTWVSENANINFPLFRPDVFSLGAAASLTDTAKDDSFLASPGSVATDDITAAVVKVSNKLQSAIRTEAIISACVVGIWVLICLIGLGRVILGLLSSKQNGTLRTADGSPQLTGGHMQPKQKSPILPSAFDKSMTSIPMDRSHDDLGQYADEKRGHAGHRSVESAHIRGQGHERISTAASISDVQPSYAGDYKSGGWKR